MTETCLPIVNWLKNWFTSTDDLIDKTYPVGSIYMSVNNTSPSTLFGGTWVQLTDTFLYASNTADTNSTTSTGGSKDAVVVTHTHTQNSHYHNPFNKTYFVETNATALATGGTKRTATANTNGTFYWQSNQNSPPSFARHTATATTTATNQNTGVDGTNKNMPPYMRVYMWKRTA